MKTPWAVAFGVVCGLLGAGILFLVLRPPRGEAIQIKPPSTSVPIVVYVNGAVVNPGVYSLPSYSRVQDVIQAAGGFLPEADDQSLNLAAILQDGVQVWVPFTGQAFQPRNPMLFLPTQGASQLSTQIPTGLININTATLEELDLLPDIGPILAQNIIDYRQTIGLFTSIEEIMLVPDIGPVTFEKIKDMITIGNSPGNIPGDTPGNTP